MTTLGDSRHSASTTSGSFFVTYLWRGLRGRARQMVIIAIGLAVGVASVVTLTAASTGVSQAQAAVLHALNGVGTDISVTTAASSDAADSGGTNASQGMLGADDAGKEVFRSPPGLGLLDSSALAAISKIPGVAGVAGGLSLSHTLVGSPPASGGLPSLTSTSLDGVDVAHLKLGPYASGTITSGRSLAAGDAESDVAVLDAGYAAAHHLRVGSQITIAKVRFTVIGVIGQPAANNPAQVFIALGRVQALASSGTLHLAGKLNAIYVSAASAADIGAVHAKIAALLPTATVTSSADLASKVNGSLATATRLATDLGRWLAAALLLAAFALAGLLTTAAVRRRVREFGTLKALGWRTRRIVAQIMAESLVIGAAGAAIGIGLGFLGATVIDAVAPTLTAVVALNPGSTPPQGALIGNGSLKTMTLPGGVHTVGVDLHATVSTATILVAIALAIGGAVLAGALGSWRAARLHPAHALVRVV
ncbi:ABC transporter permease [Rugosimonospora africana]|uniref:Membrane protein n=1 Tax=Rugosimonospora africana TaxID=556532 RepID=A0A8J3QY33_9ACTN|nr:ABC transporter permease [Rugosimonospora africana]GIH19530.1 membrane protein [Rugosimonospora africana]